MSTDLTSCYLRFLAVNPAIAEADVVILPAADLYFMAQVFFADGGVHYAAIQAQLRQLIASERTGSDGACAVCQPRP